MADPFGGPGGKRKADGVADVVNRLLQNLVIKCAKSEGVRDYYHVGVIGYGAKVGPALGGALAGREMIPISEIANNPVRIEERVRKMDDGAGGIVEQTIKFPIWLDPVAHGGTPMVQTLNQAQTIIKGWLAQYPNCFPPIVIHITDGESTDGNPADAANALKTLASNDGPTLLFNIHVSSQRTNPLEFPADADGLPDDHARSLFAMSSELPPYMQEIAQQEGYPVTANTHGFVFNADMVALIRFLDIGTRPSNLR
jgi:hypothetical protein